MHPYTILFDYTKEILVCSIIVGISSFIIYRRLLSRKYGEFHITHGYLCPHSILKIPPILIADITDIKFELLPRTGGSYKFFVTTSNGGVVHFIFRYHAFSERLRLQKELREIRYEGPFESMQRNS